MAEWVLYQVSDGVSEGSSVPYSSIGIVEQRQGSDATVWFIGPDIRKQVHTDDIAAIDVFNTGDQNNLKICKICLRGLSPTEFENNQNNATRRGVKRPTCKNCRSHKKAMNASTRREANKSKPNPGDLFTCPICKKLYIVDVTANIRADHCHKTGKFREHICDSCNTGLGRFKNGQDCLEVALEYIKRWDERHARE